MSVSGVQFNRPNQAYSAQNQQNRVAQKPKFGDCGIVSCGVPCAVGLAGIAGLVLLVATGVLSTLKKTVTGLVSNVTNAAKQQETPAAQPRATEHVHGPDCNH